MKSLIVVLLFLGIAMFYFGCSDSTPSGPNLSQNDQVVTTLAKTAAEFEGICTFVAPGDPAVLKGKIFLKGRSAEWYDFSAEEPLVSGKSMWYINTIPEKDGSQKIWGKAEIFIGVEAGGDVNTATGKWQLSWHGYVTPTSVGVDIVCYANGQGKEGVVKGMVGHWTYTMNWDFSDNSTFFYATKGHIY